MSRELLEFAAKAAGIKVPTQKDHPWAWIDERGIHRDISYGGDGTRMSHWNPLTDDGDALRVAVKLGLFSYEIIPEELSSAFLQSDPYTATRLAIVRAAAEIGRNMK